MSTEIQTFGKDYLIHIVKSGSCVVFIGPEFLKVQEQSFQKYFLGRLREENKGIKYFYPKDNLLVFNSPTSKNMLPFQFEKILKSMPNVDLQSVEKLAKIPLPFFVSINPDDFLYQTLKKWGYDKARMAYYRGRQHGNEPIETEPTIEEPLIYNLFGSFKEYQSMILDYSDMHNFLQTIFKMPEWGLPPVVSKRLQDAGIFVFLGFDFNKWYTQLLLKIIRKDEQTVILNNDPNLDASIKDFLVQGFEVGFLDTEHDNMLDALIEAFEQPDSGVALRRPRAPKSPEETSAERVRSLVSGNKIAEALDFLESISKGFEQILNDLTLQRSRFNQLKQEAERNTITTEEYNVSMNDFKGDILSMSESICKETQSQP
jgi:Effector-associated domain 11/SIR2-like domain